MQAAIQQYIDNSVSKTINLPENYNDHEELSDVIFSYAKHLKGLTVYKQGSRGQEPLTEIKYADKKELDELINKAANIRVAEVDCANGSCEI